MTVYALDPGTEQSALVVLDGARVVSASIQGNRGLLEALRDDYDTGTLVVEQIASYGMAVGREVFETCVWSGRFIEAWEGRGLFYSWNMLPRRDVKLHLCGSMKAKDANIRAALLDRYGGKAATKKGGPLYGVTSHCWAALALGVTYSDQQGRQ